MKSDQFMGRYDLGDDSVCVCVCGVSPILSYFDLLLSVFISHNIYIYIYAHTSLSFFKAGLFHVKIPHPFSIQLSQHLSALKYNLLHPPYCW